jgi:hypothetical protein
MELYKNMGIADRIIRPVAAAIIIAASANGKIKGPLEIGLLFFIRNIFNNSRNWQLPGI